MSALKLLKKWDKTNKREEYRMSVIAERNREAEEERKMIEEFIKNNPDKYHVLPPVPYEESQQAAKPSARKGKKRK